jgi:hypothetical protein
LWNLSGEHPTIYTITIKIIRQFSDLITTITEHHHLIRPRFSNKVVEQFVFVCSSNEVNNLINRLSGNFFRLRLDHNGIYSPATGQLKYIRVKGRTEQQCLSTVLFGCARYDLPNLWNKDQKGLSTDIVVQCNL